MKDYLKVFSPAEICSHKEKILSESRACLEKFSDAFNSEDLAGMDSQLNFPHTLISGIETIVWHEPGQMPENFFELLKAEGWKSTRCELSEPILISDDKVHYLWNYTRRDSENRVLSSHENLWIVTKQNGKWGISLRSY